MNGMGGFGVLRGLILALGIGVTTMSAGSWSQDVARIQSPECRPQTAQVEGMPWQHIRLVGRESTGNGGETAISIAVRVASSRSQRQAGMQHLCPESIKHNPMLFVFDSPGRVAFHMGNVHAPLDIVFMDADGHVREIRRMTPGETVVRPLQPIAYALELLAGEVERLGIEAGMHMIRDQGR